MTNDKGQWRCNNCGATDGVESGLCDNCGPTQTLPLDQTALDIATGNTPE